MKRKQMEYQTENAFDYIAAPDNPQAIVEYKDTIAKMLAALKELPQRQLLVLIHILSMAKSWNILGGY